MTRSWLRQVPLLAPRVFLGAGWIKDTPAAQCCVQTNPDGSQQLTCSNPLWVSPPGIYPGYPACGGPGGGETATGGNPPESGGAASAVTPTGTTAPAASGPPAGSMPVQNVSADSPASGAASATSPSAGAALPPPQTMTYDAQPTGASNGPAFTTRAKLVPVTNAAPPQGPAPFAPCSFQTYQIQPWALCLLKRPSI